MRNITLLPRIHNYFGKSGWETQLVTTKFSTRALNGYVRSLAALQGNLSSVECGGRAESELIVYTKVNFPRARASNLYNGLHVSQERASAL